MAGTEEQFDVILKEYHKIVKRFDARETNYVNFSQQMENLFASYVGWDRKEFIKELNKRLGIHSNQKRKTVAIAVAKKQKTPKKSAKKVNIEF